MLRTLSLFFLASCTSNNGAGSLALAQENVWNLSLVQVGMSEVEVLKVMEHPQEKKTLELDGDSYTVWFYVTQPTTLTQKKLVKRNVTPLTFKKGVLAGFGFDYYNQIVKGPSALQETKAKEGTHLEDEIDHLQEASKKPIRRSIILTHNNLEESVSKEDEEERKRKKPKVNNLDEESEERIDQEQDQNFNFW